MGENNKLSFDATTDTAQAAEYLSSIANGLRAGTIGLSAGGQSVRLHPSDTVRLEIEADGRPDDDRGHLAIEISWKRRAKPVVPTLEISSTEEEAAPVADAAGVGPAEK